MNPQFPESTSGAAGPVSADARPDNAVSDSQRRRERVQAMIRRRQRWQMLGALLSAAIFLAALVALWHLAHEVDAAQLRDALASASLRQIGLAALFTVISYSLLTGYDFLALRQLGERIAYHITALASFTSYAVSFTLGFPVVTSGTVRYWIYSPKGLKAWKIASLTVIAGITFWLGMGCVLAWSLLREAPALSGLLYLRPSVIQLTGAGVLAVLIGYFVWVSLKRRAVIVRGWRLDLPGFRLSLGQTLLGAGDVCASAAVLFVLLPGGHGISFETFLAIYVLACMLGIVSHSPGGLGVFEATMLIALSQLSREGVLGAVLLFRLFYYLIPFVLALILLALHGGWSRLNRKSARTRTS
ncbi:lysylphosphatidylglycerol synthase domain-containing protein [Pseudochelatococcus lubricantis]|uniref:lysylphosphatidylglycerol synthase domain-containing protein n=1 Tax=Pseudochelatococcus lubricantis TaxID=1538102 RepID=UPI0035EFF35E